MLSLTAHFHFFPPNCPPWVRNRVRTVVGSRCMENKGERGAEIRRRRADSLNSETKEWDVEGRSRFQISHREKFEKAKPAVPGSLYTRIVRNARKGEGRSRRLGASVNRPNQTTSTQAKGKSSQIKPNQGCLRQLRIGASWPKLGGEQHRSKPRGLKVFYDTWHGMRQREPFKMNQARFKPNQAQSSSIKVDLATCRERCRVSPGPRATQPPGDQALSAENPEGCRQGDVRAVRQAAGPSLLFERDQNHAAGRADYRTEHQGKQ